jgi:hypothetical protein
MEESEGDKACFVNVVKAKVVKDGMPKYLADKKDEA